MTFITKFDIDFYLDWVKISATKEEQAIPIEQRIYIQNIALNTIKISHEKQIVQHANYTPEWTHTPQKGNFVQHTIPVKENEKNIMYIHIYKEIITNGGRW